ncbi:hypothetical protein [Leptotrichia sp. oral taxon 221]|uniref:hypothetical protein n=1 Tax=Leptotrichia sp. oral taxon 221 TaxID=712362 RepID=UPI001B8B6C66|nr:hypothetical protein [Leptotrichia sp. oral taxon 221]QUB97926.1 hypothetical protein J4863_04275 [Leptotrichia sp. oral taxon 221]
MKLFILILYLLLLENLFSWEIKLENPKDNKIKITKTKGSITTFGFFPNYLKNSNINVKIPNRKLETLLEEFEISEREINHNLYTVNDKLYKKFLVSETLKIENKEILNNTNNIRKILMVLRNLNETFEWNEELPVFKIKNSDYVIIQSKYGSYLLDLDNLKENREISKYEYKVINDSIQNLKNINDYYKLNSKILDNFFYNKIFNFYKNFW